MKTLGTAILMAMLCYSPAIGQQQNAKRLCFSVERFGTVQGLGNFVYNGRVSGAGTGAYGHWVVAIDAGEAAWAQSGGGFRGEEGRVRFGVYNGSHYPLHWVVVAVPNQEEYEELRRNARRGTPYTVSNNKIGQSTIVSDADGCVFDLSTEDRVTAAPVPRRGECTCAS